MGSRPCALRTNHTDVGNKGGWLKVDLARLFADSEAGTLKGASEYEKVCGTIPIEIGAGGDMAVDPTEDFAYFRVSREEAAKHLTADTAPAEPFGPRGMGAGPTGLASMNLRTGEVKFVVAVPFQIGHVQANPWMPGEIVFCWETGGKAPQRTWTVKSDGSGLRLSEDGRSLNICVIPVPDSLKRAYGEKIE